MALSSCAKKVWPGSHPFFSLCRWRRTSSGATWSALTREQRLALLEDIALRDPALAGALTTLRRTARDEGESFFDNFAQIFQAFDNVEQTVLRALEAEREAEAVQRLLGEKYELAAMSS